MIHLTRLFLAVVLVGCTVAQNPVSPTVSYFAALDFTKYSGSDFLFTPEKYCDKYNSIGLISYTFLPEIKYYSAQDNIPDDYDPIYGQPAQSGGYYVVQPSSLYDGLDSIFSRATEMGADAIVDFKVDWIDLGIINSQSVRGYELSGFAIDRID